MKLRVLFYLVVMVALTAGFLVAQEITGDIRGVVKDATGALVTGAKVSVNNTDRNTNIRTITTGTDGSYVAPYLPVGHYQVVVEVAGFKKFVGSDIVLNVNDHRIVDVDLQVGGANETVTVHESEAAVDLETSEVSGLVNGTQVRELALASRNFAQLLVLQPGVSTALSSDQMFVGVTSPTGLSNQMNYSVNGGRPTQNNWMIDGADNFDRGANLTLLSFPSIDSIAEFKVLRSSYLPENGRSSAGEINLVTRSGTNKFHGSAYEFFRNDVMQANNYFNNADQIARPPLRWNDFGFTLGGPVWKNKTFFFYSQEWRKIITYTTFTSGLLPTQAELTGQLVDGSGVSHVVCVSYNPDGTCGTQSSTVTNINPIAAAYVKDIFAKIPPLNNLADQSITWTGRNIFNYREENVRIDHNFTSKLSIFGRYLDDAIPTQEPGGIFTGLSTPGLATTSTNAPGRNLAVHATYIIAPTLVNDAGYALSWGAVLSTPTGLFNKANSPDINPTLLFNTGVPRVPNIDFCAFTTNQCALDNTYGAFVGFGPYRDYNKNHNFFDNLTWVHGRHAYKFGVSYNYYTKDENVNGGSGANGTYYFGDTPPTVNSETDPADGSFEQLWANFLIGSVFQFSQTNQDFRALVHQHEIEFYGQDEYRIRPNLTLNYGLRYSLFFAPTYGNGMLSTFDPQLFNQSQSAVLNPDGTFMGGLSSQTYLNGIIIGGKNSPFGQAVARTPHGGFGPRLGFAWDPLSDGRTSIRGGYGIFYDSPAVNSVETFASENPPLTLNRNVPNADFSNPGLGQPLVNPYPASIGGPSPNNWNLPYTQMYNLDIQRQINSTTMLDVGYNGSQGRHLIGVVDVNMPHPGDFLKAGLTAPFVGNPNNLEILNTVRPYEGFDAINIFMPVFTSNYNALQAQFQKHFTGNSLIVANYTWAKNMTTASGDYSAAQNTWNLKADYGPANIDRQHVFTGSYVYYLPFYKNQQGVVGHLLGGWELSGIGYLYSGLHYTATASSSSNDFGGLGLNSATFSGARPDQVGDPQRGAPHHISEWINKSAFAAVPCTTTSCPPSEIRPGDEKRGTIVGPPMARWDANLYKNTNLTERVALQFRAEAFNVLNHTNPDGFQSLRFNSGLFGKIAGARDARVLQLALKLVF